MKKRRQAILVFVTVAMFFVTISDCLALTPEDIVPNSIAQVENDRRIDGSVNVQAFVPRVSRSKVALFDSGMLKVALEKSIAQKKLFLSIEPGNADYVLDVWIDDAIREMKVVDGYIIDIVSIWRLTRVRDGKVIVCDFAFGHGASHALGPAAHSNAVQNATREIIQKGMLMLSNSPTPLAAMYVVGDWPSMGPVIPEGYKKMRENWSMLRTGLSEEDVRKMIPSMANASHYNFYDVTVESGKRIFRTVVVYEDPFYNLSLSNNRLSEVASSFFPFRTLRFENGSLVHWEQSKQQRRP